MTTDPTASGCTAPCIACMTDESHDPAPQSVPPAPADRAAEIEQLQTENTRLRQWHDEDRTALTEMRATIERLRGECERWQTTAQNYMTKHDRLLGENSRLRAEQPAAPTPPAGQNLRDRIRRAVCEAEGFGWDTDMLEPDEYGEVADAVLAVLPAPAAGCAQCGDSGSCNGGPCPLTPTDQTSAERRDRYAAALNPMHHYIADDGYGAMAMRTAEELADAAMAIADDEQAAKLNGLTAQAIHIMAAVETLTEENARLCAERRDALREALVAPEDDEQQAGEGR